MRPIALLAFATALASAPAAAQWDLTLDTARAPGPNARAAQRPVGPNGQAAQRPLGPNRSAAQSGRAPGREDRNPNCAQALAAGTTPLRRGDAGYAPHLDPDGNGLACETAGNAERR